jgi:hypothetical protein
MTAEVIDHPIPDDPRNDPESPIPNLNVIDVAGYKKDGGADLSIVIVTPLAGDAASQTRLLDKIQGYLGYLESDDFIADAGTSANPENTTITVLLHPHSSDQIRALLSRCHQWVNEHGATLVVRDLTSEEMGGT